MGSNRKKLLLKLRNYRMVRKLSCLRGLQITARHTVLFFPCAKQAKDEYVEENKIALLNNEAPRQHKHIFNVDTTSYYILLGKKCCNNVVTTFFFGCE